MLEGHEVLRHEIQELSRKTDERFEVVDLKFEALSNRVISVEKNLGEKVDQNADSGPSRPPIPFHSGH